jgi:hypothetical protein
LGIFVSAFQSVAMPQNLSFADLTVLPAGVLRCGRTRVMRLSRFKGDAGA